MIDSVWGHMAGGDAYDKDNQFILDQVEEFLS